MLPMLMVRVTLLCLLFCYFILLEAFHAQVIVRALRALIPIALFEHLVADITLHSNCGRLVGLFLSAFLTFLQCFLLANDLNAANSLHIGLHAPISLDIEHRLRFLRSALPTQYSWHVLIDLPIFFTMKREEYHVASFGVAFCALFVDSFGKKGKSWNFLLIKFEVKAFGRLCNKSF
jgi:hypothetical protein